jgi:molecular chaperone GrpE
MIKKSFEDLLEKEGVQVIEAVDQPFDPNLHHAVMTEEKEGCDADVVIEEFQKGYKLGERVVRPSMVKVSC